MKYYLVTGASKGLGAALVQTLAEADVKIITLSRSGLSENQKLGIIDKGAALTDLIGDLSKESDLPGLAEQMMAEVNPADATQIVLINNAGGVEPIAPFYKADDAAVMHNIHLNYIAPMILSRHFGKAFRHVNCDRRIITVSSGAGKSPFFGWNVYCASKAAVDMMTRVIGLEEGDDGILAISFGPGIMDTDMQSTIRSSSEEDFKDIERFKKFKENGDLLTPEIVAGVLKRLTSEPVAQGAIVGVKDYL